MDLDGNGKISMEELSKAKDFQGGEGGDSSGGSSGNPEEDPEKIFFQFASSPKDGLTFEEFLKLLEFFESEGTR
jgi:Ca2+-binding EF-hand superfamily protein